MAGRKRPIGPLPMAEKVKQLVSQKFGSDGLKANEREAIRGVLAQVSAIQKAVLFGSRATGTYSPASDIDLVLYGDSLTLSDEFRIASSMEDLDLPLRVDLVRYATITSKELLDHIHRVGKLFYEAKRGREKAGLRSLGMAGEWLPWGHVMPHGTTAPRGLPTPELIRWPLAASRDLFELKYGKALVESNRRPGRVPVYGTNGRCGCHDEALFKGPGVILGRKGQGPLGVEWSDDDYWVIDTAYSLAPLREDIDLRYAYFLIKFIGLNHLKDGTSNPTLSRDTFGAQALPLPPLDHQRAIAHILGTLDDKIELNRRMNETLEAMARALFKSWFVDFDPVRAKAEGRDPGLPKPIADLFPDSFEDSELGPVPKGWEVQRFADTIDIIGGGTPKTSVAEYWDGDIPWFSVVDAPIDSDVWVVDTVKKVTREGVESSSTRILSVGTTIITARGTVGRIALVAVPMAMNQSCYGLRGKAGAYGFFTYFATRELVTSLQQHAHGSVFDTITQGTLAGVFLALPPAALIEAFETRVGPALQRIRVNLLSSRTLAALRDTLLPKLISGELRVKDAGRFLDDRGL